MAEKKTIYGMDKGKKAPRITVGCDPEFEFVRGSNVVTPEGTTTVYGSLGSDCGAMEIRPDAAESVNTVLQNIHALFSLAYAQKGQVLVSGNMRPLGGHIHIGGVKDVALIRKMLPMLDDFIGKLLAPVNGTKRGPHSGGYGAYSDFHEKSYGFEYRTPPSAFFHNPQFTGLVMSLAKALVEEFAREKEVTYEVDDYGVATTASIASRIGQKRTAMLLNHVERYGQMLRESERVEIDRQAWQIGKTDSDKYGVLPLRRGKLTVHPGVDARVADAIRQEYGRAGLKCAMHILPDTEANMASTHPVGDIQHLNEMLNDADACEKVKAQARRETKNGKVVLSVGPDRTMGEDVRKMFEAYAKATLKKTNTPDSVRGISFDGD